MKRLIAAGAAAALALASMPAAAELALGARAPDFTTEAAAAGQHHTFHLAGALRRGPVVLYFFPAAFTPGCTIEAHEFAQAQPEFQRLGATLIGVTAGNINRLTEFSVSECRSKFPVAADPNAQIATEYNANSAEHAGYSRRVSYVIAPDGQVIMAYADPNPDQHVTRTLEAVRKWRERRDRR
jgi:peroxiredoxin (alkyl hydroperoxide reductase subunit C)